MDFPFRPKGIQPLVARHAADDAFELSTGMLHAFRNLSSQRRINIHQMPTHLSKRPLVRS